FVAKLTDALGEAEETLVWLEVAEECGYLDPALLENLTQAARRLIGGLVKMMRHPDQWCGPAGLVREDAELYDSD
ncbi:MAG: four helix bundle protein, partial [Bacteroidota bacterium]